MTTTQTRIYIVLGNDGAQHLVRARHPSQAVSHVAAQTYKVRVATQDDLLGAVGRGIVVTDAKVAPEPSA